MGFLITLLVVILFLKLFVGISVGLFRLLLGILAVAVVIALIPVGLALLVPIAIFGAFLACVGFVLKLIF
ncbi:hypothetical protein EZV73_03425 [Acidaminobacter sp. JC074]|uniref:hypothetical protein n=1 Tax=Acidaminobacter sp. JC074 TaxID=2530199 RepID=UPI001F0F9C6F|nr:hypothetical protein [Acidaminobacter sp. JC074]MCH4886601.1 hypothetical protein [Acidaminobacter sp. JC074]